MGQDFFESLPSEIIVNILSRLPARTTMSCKCVCKPWLDLLTTPQFVKTYLSKVGPCLAVFYQGNSKPYKVVEFLDEPDVKSNEHHWNVVFSFLPPFYEPVHSSANGLILLRRPCYGSSDLILCNPVTRDYIKLPCPMRPHPESKVQQETFGLGVSRMSKQFKVVRIVYGLPITHESEKLAESDCQVYTVGTGSWRRLASAGLLNYGHKYNTGAFLNGNLHWLARAFARARAHDLNGSSAVISCFDLETELFLAPSLFPLLFVMILMDMVHMVIRNCLFWGIAYVYAVWVGMKTLVSG